MKIAFTEAGWEDYLWFQQNDRKRLKRINALIKDTVRKPLSEASNNHPLISINPDTAINPVKSQINLLIEHNLHRLFLV
jgi:Txe/YoeB family toxin of Txe-Axe toxin-antitoxin module